MLASPASIRALAFRCHRLPLPHLPSLIFPLRPPRAPVALARMALSTGPTDDEDEEEEEAVVVGSLGGGGAGGEVSLEEWQRWGTSSPIPAMVAGVVSELLEMEADAGNKMRFGGIGCKLKGDFKVLEDKKHRAVYETLLDSGKKLQYFSARQIACRLIGSRGYLCQKCWLPIEDCMCAKLAPCTLWRGMRFWLYMHPKDFLRQNNTGKLLWQVFGVQAASLCLFGIQEHEDIMWDALQCSGKGMVSFLYPNKSTTPKSVKDLKFDSLTLSSELQKELQNRPFNFVLLDGTWSNSAALYRRLKERWTATWGEDDLPCISLSMLSASVMHKLRPQPAWDRTCTAAAAAGLLWELQMQPDLSAFELAMQAEAVENSLDILLDALMARRLRMGRSIARKERYSRNCI